MYMYHVFPCWQKQDYQNNKKHTTTPILKPTDDQKPETFFWDLHVSQNLIIGSVVAERSSALDSSSDVVRMCVRIPAWSVAALVSLEQDT